MLLRLEAPRKSPGDVGVEAHLELAVENARRSSRGDLRCAAEPGRATEPVIQGHRRIGRAHHRHDEDSTRARDQDIAAPWRGGVWNSHGDYNGAFNTPGPLARRERQNTKTHAS